MRQLVLQIADVLDALRRVHSAEDIEELKTIVIFCGAGLDVALWCLANGWVN